MVIVGTTKMRILRELSRQPRNGYELAREIGLPYGATSYHLKELRGKGFISQKAHGRANVQSLTAKGRQLLKMLDG